MKFLLKSIGSTAFGVLGGWIGGLFGFAAGLYLSFIFSIVGWYLAKYLCAEFLSL